MHILMHTFCGPKKNYGDSFFLRSTYVRYQSTSLPLLWRLMKALIFPLSWRLTKWVNPHVGNNIGLKVMWLYISRNVIAWEIRSVLYLTNDPVFSGWPKNWYNLNRVKGESIFRMTDTVHSELVPRKKRYC